MGKYRKIIISILLVIGMLIVGTMCVWSYVRKQGKSEMFAANVNTGAENTTYKELEYKGKTYHYRDNIINILCIGVDKEEIMSERDDDGNSLGQADAIFVVSIDMTANQIRVIAIPRDTMVTLKQYDGNQNLIGLWDGQITLQYAYGDGQEESTLLVAERVRELLYHIPLNGYASINLSCIPVINDAIGGVELTMDEDYTLYNPEFEKGATVHLQGEAAKNFVQGRNIYVAGSAYDRLGRQKQYLQAFVQQAKKEVKYHPLLPLQLMQELDENMLTDISYKEILYLAPELIECDFSEDSLYILPGEIVVGAVYEEYYLDDEAVTDMLIDLFYEEQ